MKALGLALIAVAFLGGALIAVLNVDQVAWFAYLPVLGVGVAGLVLVKRSHRANAGDRARVHGNLDTLAQSLKRVHAGLVELAERPESLPPHQYRFEIDRRFRADLQRFADARDAMEHAFGLRIYADIMSSFAAGERYLNRIWTASADGYVDEVHAYLIKARDQFAEANREFLDHRRADGE